MKKFVIAISAALALSSVAGAQKYIGSPAQDLFDQASFYLDTQYYGFVDIDANILASKYQPDLDKACESAGINCAYTSAEPVIAAMLNSIGDGHTGYASPASVAASNAARQGQGAPVLRIGFSSRILEDKSMLINRVRPDGPAYAAGLRRGDLVIGFNGKKFSEIEAGGLTTAVRAGETITLNVVRGEAKLDFSVKGVQFQTADPSTYELRKDGNAVIWMPDFLAPFQAQLVHDFTQKAIQDGAKAIILDLRDNSGGSPLQRMWVSHIFLNENQIGSVSKTRYKNFIPEMVYKIANGVATETSLGGIVNRSLKINNPAKWSKPVSVLINEEAGSAPEYVANDIKYMKRGDLVGEPTFGVGNTSTTDFRLINGGAIGITITRNYRFDGIPYPERALPDINIADDLLGLAKTGKDAILEKAVEVLSGKVALAAPKTEVALNLPNVFPSLWKKNEIRVLRF